MLSRLDSAIIYRPSWPFFVRYEGFDGVWKALFKERWPENFKRVELINKVDGARSSVDHENDWQQLYWETHLQKCANLMEAIFSFLNVPFFSIEQFLVYWNSCLDEAAERAMLPAFDGHIGELSISGKVDTQREFRGSKLINAFVVV